MGGNTISNNNVKENMNGKFGPCNDGTKNTMRCRQVKTTTCLTSYKNKKTSKIFFNVTCKSKF